jgi:hypothetical protein
MYDWWCSNETHSSVNTEIITPVLSIYPSSGTGRTHTVMVTVPSRSDTPQPQDKATISEHQHCLLDTAIAEIKQVSLRKNEGGDEFSGDKMRTYMKSEDLNRIYNCHGNQGTHVSKLKTQLSLNTQRKQTLQGMLFSTFNIIQECNPTTACVLAEIKCFDICLIIRGTCVKC